MKGSMIKSSPSIIIVGPDLKPTSTFKLLPSTRLSSNLIYSTTPSATLYIARSRIDSFLVNKLIAWLIEKLKHGNE